MALPDLPDSSDAPPGLALLVVDVQTAFSKAIPQMDKLVCRCRLAVRAAELLGIPVLFTEQVPEKLGSTVAQVKGSSEERVFSKTGFSAFAAEGLEKELKELEIHHLLIAGLETPVCVYQTVLDALAKDFEVTLLSDAVAGRRADDAEWVLQSLARQEVNVLPTESVFYAILNDARHHSFGAFTKLVKEASTS